MADNTAPKFSVPKDPAANWKVVLVHDDCFDAALDRSNSPLLVEYLQTRDPQAVELMVKPGMIATWWTLSPLSLGFISELILREPDEARKRLMAARASIVGCEGPEFADGAGISIDREVTAGGMTLLAAKAMENINAKMGTSALQELGDIALKRSRLKAGMRCSSFFGYFQS